MVVSTCKEFTVTSNQGFPYVLVLPVLIILPWVVNAKSCGDIHIDNGNTTPFGGAVSYTVLPPGSSTVTPNTSLGSAVVYTTCSPGTYTVITKDNVSLCETRVPISILQNTLAPDISAQFDRQVIDCFNPKVTLKGQSITPGVYYSWIFVGTPNTLQGDTITALTNSIATTQTLVNTYTLVITDSSSTCRSQSVIPIYQNLYTPKPIITNGGTSALTCFDK